MKKSFVLPTLLIAIAAAVALANQTDAFAFDSPVEPPTSVTTCIGDVTTYIFHTEIDCPQGEALERAELDIRGPRDASGDVAYQVTGITPPWYQGGWGHLEEGAVYWDMREKPWPWTFRISATLVVTDAAGLPPAQTTWITTMHRCSNDTDGIRRIYPVTWNPRYCYLLPLVN